MDWWATESLFSSPGRNEWAVFIFCSLPGLGDPLGGGLGDPLGEGTLTQPTCAGGGAWAPGGLGGGGSGRSGGSSFAGNGDGFFCGWLCAAGIGVA